MDANLFAKLIESMLRSENGMDEASYDLMIQFVEGHRELMVNSAVTEILRAVDATDGQFYLKDD